MMTENIEDEMKHLGVNADFNDRDSDVTPTNSPLSSITPPTIIHYPVHSQASGLFDDKIVRYDDYDLRSDSSLSWGEDEFEGEATRIVNALFHQLDQIIYENDIIAKSIHIPITSHLINKSKQKLKQKKIPSRKMSQRRYKSKSHNDLSSDQPVVNNLLSSSELSLSDDTGGDSFGAQSIQVAQPSVALIAECKDWVEQFPHLRINGIGINIKRLDSIEKVVFGDNTPEELTSSQEEIIEQNGDYENKLQYVTLKRDDKKEVKKMKGPPSRICSGSTDPEVLKEQLLIKLFEMLWPVVSKVIEPLLTQYTYHVINQSVQYSSISREPSSRGQREVHVHSIEMESRSPPRGSVTIPHIGWRANRPISASSRSSSTKYRLPVSHKISSESINREELETFLQIKPLIIHDDRPTPRVLSASKSSSRSHSSIVSLPTLGNHRPVSSKSNDHLLTPRLTNDQRPTSTSSYTRLRFNNKYQNLNRNSTIEEGRTSEYDNETERHSTESEAESLSPTWSRHTLLPPIPDVATFVENRIQAKDRQQGSYSSPHRHNLSVRGKSLSASTKMGRLALSSRKEPTKPSQQAGPFVSWIVSKVEKSSVPSPPATTTTVKQANKINNNNVPIDKTKYYRRASHH